MIVGMAMAEVAAYLRVLRRGRGHTQESLAEAAETSKRTIERLERAEGDLTVPTFLRICAVLRASGEHVQYLAVQSGGGVRPAEVLAEAWLRGEDLPLPMGVGLDSAPVPHDDRVTRAIAAAQDLAPDQLVDVIVALSQLLQARRAEYIPRGRMVRRTRPKRPNGRT